MWVAWFNVRFPRRDSRCTVRPDDENSIGAVPHVVGAVPGRREATDVAGVIDDRRVEDRADPVHVDERGAGGLHGVGDALLGPLRPHVEQLDLLERLLRARLLARGASGCAFADERGTLT